MPHADTLIREAIIVVVREFHCPLCLAKLRLAVESQPGMQFSCPDCRCLLQLLELEGRLSAIEVATSPELPAVKTQMTGEVRQASATQARRRPALQNTGLSDSGQASSTDAKEEIHTATHPRVDLQRFRATADRTLRFALQRSRPLYAWLASPLAVAWTVAGFITLTIIIWLLKDNPLGRSGGSDPVPASVTARSDPENGDGTAATDDETVERRLTDLAGRIQTFREHYGRFPEGRIMLEEAPAQTSFGWLARLEAEYPSAVGHVPPPLWDRGWRDPLNDPFVRRRLPALRNPLLPAQAGAGGYPATHFVGAAGIGADGPLLPSRHPRAGIFAYDRATRIEDIVDGLSNTFLILGLEQGLGCWADGTSSIRPLTQAPYVRGPDGFGTGQADGMFVLMADGSVRFLSSETDPVIVRRMMAMADGLPLDPSVAGDPLELPVPDVALADAAGDDLLHEDDSMQTGSLPVRSPEELIVVPDPVEIPIDVLLAEDSPRQFIEQALQLRLRKFDQPRPVALRTLLRTLEEMVGYSFHWNVPQTDEWVGILERPVSISLNETTLEEVLVRVLDTAGLQYRLLDEGITIEPQSALE